jgi:Ca2+-binding RTX toxin-like protein
MATFTAGTAGLNMSTAIAALTAPTSIDDLIAITTSGEQQVWSVTGGYFFADLSVSMSMDGMSGSFTFNRLALLNNPNLDGSGTYKWDMSGSLISGSYSIGLDFDSFTLNIPGLISGTISLSNFDINDLTIAPNASFSSVILQGNDVVTGSNTYADNLLGGAGNDVIKGNGGGDILSGGSGGDKLYGGAGNDKLTGGAGADDFYFNTAPGSGNVDTIKDFVHLTDDIVLDKSFFGALGTLGNLAGTAFKAANNIGASSGGTGVDSSDRILYDTDTGNLYYDSNGSGSGGRVLIATVWSDATHHPVLTAADFLIVA